MNAAQNPYAPPEVDLPQTPTVSRKHHIGWDRVLLVLAIIVCAVGAPLAFYEIESIVGSGIAMFVVCLLLLIRECYCRLRMSRPPWWFLFFLSLFGLAFVFGLVALIGLLQWSPRQAGENYVVEMVTCFALLMAGASAVACCFPPAEFSDENGTETIEEPIT